MKRIVTVVLTALLVFLCCIATDLPVQAKSDTITLNYKTLTMQVGDNVDFNVLSGSQVKSSKNVTWKSSNKKIATVDKNGIVTAKKKGTVTITATTTNKKSKASCKVTVEKKVKPGTKVLVAYFSATNTTKGVAKKIASVTGGDLYKIIPAKAYSSKDLNYNNEKSRTSKEQNNENARPQLKGKSVGIGKYDIIFLGYPIWWGDAPRILNTFVESYDFSGKKIIPFCTSGSSGIEESEGTLKALAQETAIWMPGMRFDSDVSKTELSSWVESLKLYGQEEGENPSDDTTGQNPSDDTSGQNPSDDTSGQNPSDDTSGQNPSDDTSGQNPSDDTSGQNPSDDTSGQNPSDDTSGQNPSDDTSGQNPSDGKTLVAYFSCTNNTKGIAELIAEVTGADIYQIMPEEPYTSADLNYSDNTSRTSIEQNDPAARPAITGTVDNMSDYTTIYLGYPIWWGNAPRIISTFMESYDFSGKTIIPFCTSGSSGIGSSAKNLQPLASDSAIWKEGKRFSGSAAKEEITAWISELGL